MHDHESREGRVLIAPPAHEDAMHPNFSSSPASDVKILLDARSLPIIEYGAQRRSREVKRREARARRPT